MATTLMDRFRAKVEFPGTKGGCWEWRGARNSRGYGQILVNGKTTSAHRVSFCIYRGEPGEMHVLHRCDNRGCVNPQHLFLGTHTDNMRDMTAKGRHGRYEGERHHSRKLTEDGVRELRRLHAEGTTYTALAAQFGMSINQARRVALRMTWKHVA